MITDASGDMFKGGHSSLVCPVNMVGTMGNGLAKYFSLRYPGLLEKYQAACRKQLFAGHRSVVFPFGGIKVICLPTKRHWVNPSNLLWIDDALKHLISLCEREGINEIGMPAIGCGKGELDWFDVKFLVHHHFKDSPVHCTLYSPT